MRLIGLMAVSLSALVACNEDSAPLGSTFCDPAQFAFLIGQDKSAVTTAITPEVVRVLGLTSPATMDFNPERLNVLHDDAGRIMEVSCG